ncbi:MAG: aminotransferase class IV [Planctomycetaceae bacterium]
MPQMSLPVAWLNGEIVPFDAARLGVWDRGVVQGVTVTDMVRTFRQQPFLLDDHLDRFAQSCRAIGVVLPESTAQVSDIVRDVLDRNRPCFRPNEELGLLLLATPGSVPMYESARTMEQPSLPVDIDHPPVIDRPTLCVHPFRLPVDDYAKGYRDGVAIAVPSIRQIPADILSPQIKYRSRLHWWLADQEARLIDPAATALLLDANGYVTETASGNLFVVKDGEFLTPRFAQTLAGISRSFVIDLLAKQQQAWREADLTVAEVAAADELFLTSTTYCLMPVTRLNGQPIAQGKPGPQSRQLLAAWSRHVGCDIVPVG